MVADVCPTLKVETSGASFPMLEVQHYASVRLSLQLYCAGTYTYYSLTEESGRGPFTYSISGGIDSWIGPFLTFVIELSSASPLLQSFRSGLLALPRLCMRSEQRSP